MGTLRSIIGETFWEIPGSILGKFLSMFDSGLIGMSYWAQFCLHTRRLPMRPLERHYFLRCMAEVPTNLDFYQPTSTMPLVEREFARELFSDLKRVRRLAQQEIKKALGNQKKPYDKSAKESVVKENDLVMLKVELQFKLDI